MRDTLRRVLTIMLFIVLIIGFYPSSAQAISVDSTELVYGENGTITRAEWIHNLVVLFDMTIEEADYPDNYYSDLSEESNYYAEIMMGVEFGLIDLPAGSEFMPDEPVTRDFAAYTMNYCLGYTVEEDVTYSFIDIEDVAHPEDAHIALERGWLTLSDERFMPDEYLTSTEAEKMCVDAIAINESLEVDENYDNQFEYKEGVIVVPETTEIFLEGEDKVIIYDISMDIHEGDEFAVYLNGLPKAYTAEQVQCEEERLVVTVSDLEDGVTDIDAQGVVEGDLGTIQPTNGNKFTLITEQTESTTSTYGVESRKSLTRISGDQKVTGLKLDEIVLPNGEVIPVSLTISNVVVSYNVNALKKEAMVAVTADINSYASAKLSVSTSAVLGTIPIGGVGSVTITAYIDVTGKISITFSTTAECGFQYDPTNGFRTIRSFRKTQFCIATEINMDMGYKLSVSTTSIPFVSAEVYFKTGVNTTILTKHYEDGQKPDVCRNISSFVYADAGANVSVKFVDYKYSKKFIVIDEENSPCRLVYHFEDEVPVGVCTRNPYGWYSSKYNSRYGNLGAYGFDGEGNIVPVYTYTLDEDGNATITGYTGKTTVLSIPENVDGHSVVAIGAGAFKGRTDLQIVVIPDSVTRIKDEAFLECSRLCSVTLSPNIAIMDCNVFQNCDSLTSIFIPKSLQECTSNDFAGYHGGPFNGCDNLKQVVFEEDIKKIPARLFYKCTGIEEIEIPESVTTIEWRAFMYCSNLKKVTIPDSVTEIGGFAFSWCESLTDLRVPKNLVVIWEDSFSYCTSLESIWIPKSLETVKFDNGFLAKTAPFGGCKSLKTIEFEEGVTLIPDSLFSNCTGIEKVTIPGTVKTIEKNAFKSCSNLEEIVLEDGLITIGYGAFAQTSIASLKIPDTVVKIDENAFNECEKLADVCLSRSLTYMGKNAFGNCLELKKINIPKSLENCGVGPFANCANLKEVSFEDEVKMIAPRLLFDCTGIEEIQLPDTIVSIGAEAFDGCVNLDNIKFNDALTKIEDKAFYNCSALVEVVIPDSVNYMGNYIFSGCTNLQKVELQEKKTNIQEGTFQNCSSLKEINLPDTLETISTNAFQNCISLTEINIPEKVHTIYDSAFSDCTGLTKVTLPASMRTINKSAFSHCESLTDLTVAEGTTTIGANAFEYCVALEKVTLPDSLQTLGNYVFAYCDKLAEINIGAGLKTIPNYCFYEDPAITKVVLPQQVTTINQYAFGNCTGLTDITINRNVTTIDATAFSYPDKLTIHGVTGTYAETFATENGITFASLDTPATAIKLNATELEIGRKEIIQMSASITPTDSSDQFTWTSSDETVVTIDATGKLTANALGTATIIAMAGDVIETCEVSVYEPVTSVSLNKTSYTGTIGDTLQLTASVRPANATYTTVKWSSSDAEIAEVTDSGLVTLKKYGTATITVTTDNKGKTATCKVTVQPIAVTGVSLNTNAQTLGLGDTYQLTETITPENATTKDVTWTSSKPAVATVENGMVTAVGEGTAIIIVKTNDGAKTASCTITVKNILITGITLDKTTLEMETKTTQTLVASVTPSDASVTSVVWSSDNEAVATVTNGKVTALKAGTATITVASKDGSCSASCVVTVTGRGVTGVELSKESISLIEGNCTLLEAIVTPANADDTSVNWAVSDENVVTIDSSIGIVKGIAEGTATITVTTNDGGYKAVCEVEVVAADESQETVPVTEVTIETNSEEISEENTIEVGKDFTLNASVEPTDATNQNIIWISSDKEIATVSPDGVVTTNGVGEVTFTAVSENGAKQAEITIQVLPVAVTGVMINIEEVELLIGEETILQASVLPENATNREISWSSSQGSIVSVDANGKIKANALGTATVTATTEDGEFKASCKVTVKPILVTSINLDSSKLSLAVGDKQKLTATVLPDNVTDKTIQWSSSNEKVATVDTNGNVTAIAEGTANIIAKTVDGSGVETQCAVTVTKKQEPTTEAPTTEQPKPEDPTTQQPTTEQPKTEEPTTEKPDTTKKLPKVGTKKTISGAQYKVTKSTTKSKEVAFVKPSSSKKTSFSVPATVKISGYTYKVTAISDKAFKNNKKLKSVTIGKNVKKIGKEAFYNCKKLKKITIKSTVLKSVGKNAIKNIDKKATIKVPKKQLRKYKKLFKSKTGYKKTMKIKK